MKRVLIYFIFLLAFSGLSYAQFNPLTPNDSTKPAMPVPPNPFITPKDMVNIFDSLHGNLTVYIKNINRIIGNINIAVFNSYASFANNGPVFRGAIIPVTATMMVVPFDSLPKGIYSVAVFHDEDKNGVLNKNQMNIPLEGYGFSNNAAANLGPPNYAQTKFIYSGKNKSITIFMTYFKFPK
ncbi:MAG TPA: DUF2141 domain-containing protein [Bacteroidales bacterium]|nr:DUF2141 domain-containing protein [Bacteroidales bacterium]